jgi:hypothetical protein
MGSTHARVIDTFETPRHEFIARYAVCDDGSAWALMRRSNSWHRVPKLFVDISDREAAD